MTQLILEEGGRRRRFRMSAGILTVGSGEGAKLRLSSPQIADVHLELESDGQAVRLRPRPGVLPPKVGGVPISTELVLTPGKAVEVGAARLWIEREATSDVRNEPAAAPSASRRRPARARRAARAPRERSTGRPGGIPTWLIVVGFAVVAGIAALFVLRRMESMGSGSANLADLLIKDAHRLESSGNLDEALAKLDQIPDGVLDADGEKDVAALRERISERRGDVALYMENEVGTRYFDAMLSKYEAHWLQGTPDKAKVRLFLERIRTFRQRWPRHPELAWCDRQEARFTGYVDLAAPLDLADVKWQVRDLTGGSPRNYLAALAILDEFLSRASGAERTEAEALRDTQLSERAEYAQDRLYQAQYEFEKKNDPPKAVWWLVHNVAWLGDPDLADESARFLVKMPDLAGHLRGYHLRYPDLYEAVVANPIVAAWVRDTGFTP
jgi:hypothetical protein